jgi:Peptidase M15.
MHYRRFRPSSAVIALFLSTAFCLPASASAFQLYSRGAQASSSAVANRHNSEPTDLRLSAVVVTANNSAIVAEVHGSASAKAAVKGSGLSGKVFARFMLPEDWISLISLPGDPPSAMSQSPVDEGFQTVFTMRSFAQKVKASLNGYRLGYWPEERGRLRSEAYRNPEGFIEVTPEDEDTRVSEHFRLRDFVSHGQDNVWPKYVVLREPLLDKLELVIEDLNEHGINAEGLRIRSGFRTPAHNTAVRDEGSARDSRHQFGDAADVFIDQEGNGKMSDLNGDGRADFSDVKLILAAVERVEARYPELVGGTGLYAGRSGSFAHIDVRGTRARWVRGVRRPTTHRFSKARKPAKSRSLKSAHASTAKSGKSAPAKSKSPGTKTAPASSRARALASAH